MRKKSSLAEHVGILTGLHCKESRYQQEENKQPRGEPEERMCAGDGPRGEAGPARKVPTR